MLELLDDSFWLLRSHAWAASFLLVLVPAPIALATDLVMVASAALGDDFAWIAATVVIYLPFSVAVFVLDVVFVTLLHEQSAAREASLRVRLAKLREHWIVVVVTGLFLNVAIMLGVFLLILPAIYLSFVFLVAVPVGVAEGTWSTHCLRRSGELMKGHKRRVAGPFLAYVALDLVLAFLFDGSAVDAPASFWAYHVASSLLGAWVTAFSFLLYLDIRSRKEGYDLERLAQRAGEDPA